MDSPCIKGQWPCFILTIPLKVVFRHFVLIFQWIAVSSDLYLPPKRTGRLSWVPKKRNLLYHFGLKNGGLSGRARIALLWEYPPPHQCKHSKGMVKLMLIWYLFYSFYNRFACNAAVRIWSSSWNIKGKECKAVYFTENTAKDQFLPISQKNFLGSRVFDMGQLS